MRLYYLDALRSFLILCVVLTHSAQIYNPSHSWLIYINGGSVFASLLVKFLVLLIMPTFFILAGYFSVISFLHSHGITFLFKRLLRLFLPFMTIVLTLNVLQAFLLVSFGWQHYTIKSYILNGDWIQHTWFLINLITYTLISFFLITYSRKKIKLFFTYLISKIELFSIYLLLAFLPFINIALLIIYKFIPYNYALGINLTQIIGFMPFYFFGILLFLSQNLLKKFSNISILFSAIVIIISFLITQLLETRDSYIIYKLFYFYFRYLAIWFISSFSFTVFYKFLNMKSVYIFKISDASYTIYLVHHVMVVLFGMIVIYFNIKVYLGIIILFFTSVFVSYIFHRKFVLKIPILQLLLNGKKNNL